MHQITVGEKYTGPVPQQDGLYFEIGPDGDMQLLIQFKNPSHAEKEALLAGFRQYSLLCFHNRRSPEPLLCFIFKFAAPVSYMDAPFHAGLYRDSRIQKFLDAEQNLLTVVMLDGDIVQGLRVVGLHPEAMRLFKKTALNQTPLVQRNIYDRLVDDLNELSSEELFHRGYEFSHRETKQ